MTEQQEKKPVVTIDGKKYDFASLNDEARKQLINLRACDEEIARRQRQLVIAQAAKAGFGQLLKAELPAE